MAGTETAVANKQGRPRRDFARIPTIIDLPNLIEVQQLKNDQVQTYLQGLISENLNSLEQSALDQLTTAGDLQRVGAALNTFANINFLAVAGLNPSSIGFAAQAAAQFRTLPFRPASTAFRIAMI